MGIVGCWWPHPTSPSCNLWCSCWQSPTKGCKSGKDIPSLKYKAFCSHYIMPISCYAFRVSENQGLKSHINDQFTEADIHSREHMWTDFSPIVLKISLGGSGGMTNAEDVRSIESKWRMHRILFCKKKGFARSLFIWTIMWPHLEHESCSEPGSSLVFSVLCEAR